MTIALADRVLETTSTTGTGTYSLNGAATGYQTFVAGIGNGVKCSYVVSDGTDWETGIGTVTSGSPDTLARTTVLQSSNADAAVNWGAGTKDVWVAPLATRPGILLSDMDGDTLIQVEESADEDIIRLDTGGTQRAQLGSAGLLLGDTSNAGMTFGLTINQAGADDEILSLKSSDVAHGATTYAETDTFGALFKSSGADGGLRILGLAETSRGTGVLLFDAHGGGASMDTAKSTSANAGITFRYRAHNGSNAFESLAADANVFSIQGENIGGGARTLFIVDEDGDLHVDGSTSLTAFDAHDDAMLARAFDLARDPDAKSVIRTAFDDFARTQADRLVEAGILGRVSARARRKGHRGLVNVTQLQRLHNGAIWQHQLKLLALVETLEAQLPGFRAALAARFTHHRLPALPLAA